MNDSETLTTGARRFRTRRRRFLLVATAALAAVGAAMGISFTADTGTATVSVTAGSTSSLVYPVAASAALPSTTGDVINWGGATDAAALAYNTHAAAQAITATTSNVILPSWTPVAGAAGSVTTPGDLFVIDRRTASAGGAAHLTVTVYITNLSNLQSAYSSFAWPVDLYWQQAAGSSSPRTISGGIQTPGGTTTPATKWETVQDGAASTGSAPFYTDGLESSGTPLVSFVASDYFLTNTGGFLTYYLPTGADYFYEIALDAKGSFYTVNTSTASNLEPQFFVTAQAT